MRIATLFTDSFLLAAAAFLTTLLLTPQTIDTTIPEAAPTRESVTICEYLPTGDVATCTIQN